MNKEYLRKKMKNKKICPTRHFLEKSHIRGIEPDYVKELLISLENLVAIKVQEEKEDETKLELIFEKSRKYDLRVIISVKENKKVINIVTAHIQSKKKRKRLEKWLRKLR